MSASLKWGLANLSTWTIPSATSLRSIGVLFVFTSPMLMVMLWIQRSCNRSATGFSCTPTFATRPAGGTICVAMSNVSGMPTASTATSTLRPSVTAMTFFFHR